LQVLKPAAIAHGELVDWEITGYDEFLGFSLTELLEDMALIDTANIPSPIFKKEVQKHFVKRAARSYDLDPQAVQSALAEIDATDL
jgi:hypothetical protein